MRLIRRIFFLCFVSLFFLGCRNAKDEVPERNFEKIRSMVQVMEERGSKMAQELDTVAHYYERMVSKKDSILGRTLPSPYRFEGPFSTNQPGQDSTLSSLIILNTTPDRKEAEREVISTNFLDSAFKVFMDKNNMAAQVFSNSARQVSRVFPAYDAKNIIDPNLDVTKFNFYYEGDLDHNPSKGLVWIPEVYLDPAGKGWTLSLIHPIYEKDKLFAVLGVDYTVSDLIEGYLNSEEGEFLLVNSKGDIVAGKSGAIEMLSMPPLKNHIYRQTVLMDNFRISDFNIFNSKSGEVRKMAQAFILEKKDQFVFQEEANLKQAICVPFNSISWYLIEVFPNY